MKAIIIPIIAFLLFLPEEQARAFQPVSQISVAQFGAIPNDTINDRDAIQKAVNYCKSNKVKRLILPAGQYIIAEEQAIQLMNDIINRKFGRNPQETIYTPYYPYTKGIHIDGAEQLEVVATGAKFLVRGWMEPLSIENSQKVTITGLTIDYETLPHSEALVVNEGEGFFDGKVGSSFIQNEKVPMPRIMFWDLSKNRIAGKSLYFPNGVSRLDSQTVRITAAHPSPIKGCVALINHTFHFRPAILINGSSNISLKQVTIHSQPGMGIVGHRSENIFLNGLRIVPRPGLYQSTNTDATHFTSCKGLIRFDGCSFEGQGDDATNVHGYYQRIVKQQGTKSYSIEMEKTWGTHAMVLDYPDKGDSLELVEKKTLRVAGTYLVKKTQPYPAQWSTTIELDRPLPANTDAYYLIDVTRLPRLEFVNSYVGSHLARAILVKTRGVLIENNTFRESTGTAIHVGAEGDWREGPGSADVVIRNNRILRCGSGDGTNNDASAIAINVKAPDITTPGIHKNILIEGNLIEGDSAQYAIAVLGASNVTIRNNTFTGVKQPLFVNFSEKVTFENNYQSGTQLKSIFK